MGRKRDYQWLCDVLEADCHSRGQSPGSWSYAVITRDHVRRLSDDAIAMWLQDTVDRNSKQARAFRGMLVAEQGHRAHSRWWLMLCVGIATLLVTLATLATTVFSQG